MPICMNCGDSFPDSEATCLDCQTGGDHDIDFLRARVAELENENRILKNEVDDLRAFAKIHTDHAKRTLGLPIK